jgi:hypothetical protein
MRAASNAESKPTAGAQHAAAEGPAERVDSGALIFKGIDMTCCTLAGAKVQIKAHRYEGVTGMQ